MKKRLTLEELAAVCGYGTHINIKRSDNGKVIINGLWQLKTSKDKRQMAKWEAFKTASVYWIQPCVDVAWYKHDRSTIALGIEAHMSKTEYDLAMARVELSKGEEK